MMKVQEVSKLDKGRIGTGRSRELPLLFNCQILSMVVLYSMI